MDGLPVTPGSEAYLNAFRMHTSDPDDSRMHLLVALGIGDHNGIDEGLPERDSPPIMVDRQSTAFILL
jgi:hypothetical protein